jgi:hypothetical protein
MNSKAKSLLTLTMIVLVVSIINGIFDIAYNMRRTFEASVTNEYGETVRVRLIADSGRPPFLWYLAWKAGGQIVENVTLSVSILPSATNVNNLKVTYYLKGVSGANSQKFLEATNYLTASGTEITNSTGAVDINTHLTELGLSTTQDQTVDYYIYVKVEGDGLISGEHLVAEVSETKFDTVFYDYGVEASKTFYPLDINHHVFIRARDDDAYSDAQSGTNVDSFLVYKGDTSNGLQLGQEKDAAGYYIVRRVYLGFNTSTLGNAEVSSATLKLYLYSEGVVSSREWYIKVRQYTTENFPPTTSNWNDYGSTDLGSYYANSLDGKGSGYTFEISIDASPIDTSGMTSLMLLSSRDLSAIAPTYGYPEYIQIHCEGSNPSYRPRLIVSYLDFSASWSWLHLPLSIVSLPIGQQFIAIIFMVLAFAVWVVSRERRRRR